MARDGSTFGINLGFSLTALGGHKFAEACESGKIKIQGANSTEQNLKKMKIDRIQFYINDRLTDISAYPSIKQGLAVSKNYGHLGFTKKNEKFQFLPDFKHAFDEVIKEMKASKRIEKIVEEYLK